MQVKSPGRVELLGAPKWMWGITSSRTPAPATAGREWEISTRPSLHDCFSALPSDQLLPGLLQEPDTEFTASLRQCSQHRVIRRTAALPWSPLAFSRKEPSLPCPCRVETCYLQTSADNWGIQTALLVISGPSCIRNLSMSRTEL